MMIRERWRMLTSRFQMGEVHVIKDGHEECGFRMEYSPNNVLEMPEEFNITGYQPPCAKNPNDCAGCGFCEILHPEFATCSSFEEKECSPNP